MRMLLRFFRAAGLAGLLLALGRPAHAQQVANNDGFQRRNGQMQVVRNGQARPMTRDAHLPTGALVTKDGFVVSTDGRRTELREGQGCDLRGRPVAVRTAPDGTLALASPAAPARAPRAAPPSVLDALFGPADGARGYFFTGKKWKKLKHHVKGHGRGKGHWKDEDDD